MSTKSAKYLRNFKVENGKEISLEPCVIRVNYKDGSTWDVPIADDNSDYQTIKKEVEEGTLTIEEAD